MNENLTVEKAKEILNKYVKTPFIISHSIESGVVMRALAKHFNENETLWEIAGILHDLDMDIIGDDYSHHGEITVKTLKEEEIDNPELFKPILAHTECLEEMGGKYKRESKIDFSLAAAEQITGIITAYAKMRPEKFDGMQAKSLTKKFKDKSFAAKVNRDFITDIEKTGLNRSEFFDIAIKAISEIQNEIEL